MFLPKKVIYEDNKEEQKLDQYLPLLAALFLQSHHFIHTAGVPATLKHSIEKGAHYLFQQAWLHNIFPQAKNIGIIVQPGMVSCKGIMT